MSACRWMVVFFLVLTADGSAAPVVQIARNGLAVQPIVISTNASGRVHTAADQLAGYLSRITGGQYKIITGDGTQGIAVGRAIDFPNLPLNQKAFDHDGFAWRDTFLLRSHEHGLWAIGTTDLAVENAVWELLDRCGYRQFFPGKAWEVIPHSPDLQLDVDTVQKPDYALRGIWYGWGTWPENDADTRQWEARNRVPGGFQLNTGHAYEQIVEQNKSAFDQHPEYYALADGRRTSDKMCLSNPAVQKLIVDYCLKYLKNHPDADSVSVEPSDGGGWCECEPCARLGTPSDRALFIANIVAQAIQKSYPGKYAAMYAYYQHSPPPTRIKADPHVIVSVATAFMQHGTPEEILNGWKKMGVAQFGIREYYAVIAWDHDWPGAANGSNSEYLARTIPQFYNLGARFMVAESGDDWGPCGLGYYLAARMLWDVDQAKNLDALKEDFYQRAFGPAASPMGEFYKLIDGANKPLLSADLVGRMYRHLQTARRLAGQDEPIQQRIDQLVLYARYVELYRAYLQAGGEAHQNAYAALIQHAYRIRRTHMVHSLALYRDLYTRDKTVHIPAGAEYDVPEGKNPWKSSAPWTRQQIDQMIQRGIAENKLLDFKPVSFSDQLIPAAKALGLKTPEPSMPSSRQDRGTVRYYTWIDNAPAQIRLRITGGLAYGTLGDISVRLFPAAETLGRAVSEQIVPPDKKTHEVILRTSERGLHYIEISDNHDATRVQWEPGIAWTVPLSFSTRYDAEDQQMYFYVPRGTRIIGGYAGVNRGKIIDPQGRTALELSSQKDFFSIPVPSGMDGRLWRLNGQTYEGAFMLMTVPPYMARAADELLLPREVVQRDRR